MMKIHNAFVRPARAHNTVKCCKNSEDEHLFIECDVDHHQKYRAVTETESVKRTDVQPHLADPVVST